MYIVYILRSKKFPAKLYKGYTSDLKDRLERHNRGIVKSTKLHKPWIVVFYSVFGDEKKARDFEKYLKSGSGIAFMRKRLIS